MATRWDPGRGGRARTARRAARACGTTALACGATALALALQGCDSYARKDVDLAAHRSEFLARTPQTPELQGFAEALAPRSAGTLATFDPTDGLTEPEAEVVAIVFNADLRLARLKAGIALASAENAGLWDDPVVGVDLQRVMGNAPTLEVLSMIEFTIPISGRLELEKQHMGAEHAAELARVAQEEWRVRIALRRAWTDWSALELELRTTQEFIERIDALLTIVQALEKAGELRRIDARLFHIEQETRRAEVTMLRARVREAALELRHLMGLAPRASVELAHDGLGSPAYEGPAPAELDGSDLGARSPLMLVAQAEYEATERALELEIRKQIPDLKLGPGYGQLDGADEFMLGIGLPIPILNANRLAIAQAKAKRELARAGAEIALERLMASAQMAAVKLEAATAVREQYERTVVPMVDAQYGDARRVAELGEVDTYVLLESLTRQQRAKIELIEARRREALARIDIEEVIGPAPVAAKETTP